MRSRRNTLSTVLLAVALVAVAIPASGDDPAKVGVSKGTFEADCAFSHRAPDDPIVFPGQPGMSHSHDFFGSRTTNAASTNDSIRWKTGTCQRGASPFADTDRSAYWVPTLYVDDKPVTHTGQMAAYYSTGYRPLTVEPFPDDLRIIAGNAKGGPQEINGQRVYYWSCAGGTIDEGSARVAPTCETTLELSISFPDCWDGVNSDSADHKSHMAYSGLVDSQWACPPSHPVVVPMLRLSFRYPTHGGPTTRLASGTIDTAHADFLNGWDPDKLAALCRICLNGDRYCGGSDRPVPGHD